MERCCLVCSFNKKETPVQVFPFKLREVFQDSFYVEENLRVSASKTCLTSQERYERSRFDLSTMPSKRRRYFWHQNVLIAVRLHLLFPNFW